MKTTITFPAQNISRTVAFHGTDAENETAEKIEQESAEKILSIINVPDFIALEYRVPCDSGDARRILHRSTRPGVKWQLSYIDPDGIPAMHENFVNIGADIEEVGAVETEERLAQHFVNKFLFEKSLTIELLSI